MVGWIVFAVGAMAGSSGDRPGIFNHVRSVEPALRSHIADGYRRSGTFRAMVDRVEALPCVVYLGTAVKLSQGMRGALLHSVVGRTEMPVLRVLVRANLSDDEAISVIAHELQHVYEVMSHHEAGHQFDMTAVFEQLDLDTGGRSVRKYETAAAIAVANTVRDEVRLRGPQSVVSR